MHHVEIHPTFRSCYCFACYLNLSQPYLSQQEYLPACQASLRCAALCCNSPNHVACLLLGPPTCYYHVRSTETLSPAPALPKQPYPASLSSPRHPSIITSYHHQLHHQPSPSPSLDLLTFARELFTSVHSSLTVHSRVLEPLLVRRSGSLRKKGGRVRRDLCLHVDFDHLRSQAPKSHRSRQTPTRSLRHTSMQSPKCS